MDLPPKKVISFYLDESSMHKLDALATSQRRNRSTQVAFLIDEAYRQLFPQNGGQVAESAPCDDPKAE